MKKKILQSLKKFVRQTLIRNTKLIDCKNQMSDRVIEKYKNI